MAAGFITDNDSQQIISRSSKTLKSILKSSSPVRPLIDMNEAIRQNVVILPDSTNLTQNVEYVVDLKTGHKCDFETACDRGIIDVRGKRFCDTRTQQSISLFEALGKNYIIMKNELSTNYDADLIDNEEDEPVKKAKSKPKKLTHRDISSVFNPKTGEQISVEKAEKLGLYNTKSDVYTDALTRRKLTLDEAVQKGLAVPKQDKFQSEINEGFQYLHIRGIVNPVTGQEMQLNEAIASGFLDYTECEFHDPNSTKPLTLLEAYDKGFT